MSGTPPFCSASPFEVLHKNRDCDIKYDGEGWMRVSKEGKDLVRKLLRKDPETRPTAKTVLSHPWFRPADPALNSPASNMSRHDRHSSSSRFNVACIHPDSGQEFNEHPDNKCSIENLSYLHSPITLATRRRHNSSYVSSLPSTITGCRLIRSRTHFMSTGNASPVQPQFRR